MSVLSAGITVCLQRGVEAVIFSPSKPTVEEPFTSVGRQTLPGSAASEQPVHR